MICKDTPPMCGWLGGSVGQWVGQVKWLTNNTWPNWDNSILFEDLWFVKTPPPMGGCVGDWVGQWVGSSQMTKNLINLDLIKIIQFCLKISNRMGGVWVVGWVSGSMGGVKSKSTHPPTHSHPPMGGSVSTNHKSSNRIELSWFSQQFLNF